jgi:hypothetical protein
LLLLSGVHPYIIADNYSSTNTEGNATPEMSPVDSPSSPPPPVPVPIVSTNPKVAAQQAAANDAKNIVRRKLTGYVGFANLPNQWHRKSVRKGFNFNVMVVGMLVRSGDIRVPVDACTMMLTVM